MEFIIVDAGTAWFLIFILAAYFLPSIVAMLRGHQQGAVVYVLNLFLGWTLLGWVAALALAVSYVDNRK